MFTSTALKYGLATIAFVALFALVVGTVSTAQAAEPKHLSKKQVKTLIATAKSPADHMQLARYFKAEADRLEAEAKEHDELAEVYRKSMTSQASAIKNPMAPNTAGHCEYFAKSVREAAKSARELAAAHEQMAKDAGANVK